MSRPTHYGRAYHTPHPDTLLAFLSRGVFYLCEAGERTIANDQELARLSEISIRRDTEAEFPELSAEKIAVLVAERIAAARVRASYRVLRDERSNAMAPKPKIGSRRREIPRHQPLRPETLIIFAYVQKLTEENRGLSKNKIRERVTKHLNQGLRDCDRDCGLEVRGVRSAEAAFWDKDPVGAVPALRAYNRYQRDGKTHPWDRRFLDFAGDIGNSVTGAEFVEEFSAIILARVTSQLLAMERLYDWASDEPAFQGLRGEKLADAIEQRTELGFECLHDQVRKQWLAGTLSISIDTIFANEVA
ncbi:MAG: hypothetical protein DI537_37605 [Stutzerimonas stutzeri]|nr:MAG: hypothetical protein DI537_37605 [Stutzerimonas stutzeri]